MTAEIEHTVASAEPRGLVVWITGRPSSGKTTFAAGARRALLDAGHPVVVLDGDEVRESIVPAHGYGPADRAAFYSTLARLAALLSRQGLIVVVAATAHRESFRREARERAGVLLQVYVDTAKEECESRDDKGLYARARAGEIGALPSADFEVPAEPDLVAHGGRDTDAIARLLVLVARRTS